MAASARLHPWPESTSSGGGPPWPLRFTQSGQAIVSEDTGSSGFVPGRFRYQFNSITAAATFHGSVATLNVRNGTGSELGAPALYIVSSDDRRYDGVARGAEPIPDGEQVTLEFTFPGTVGPETIGLAVLAFGEVNVGAMSPVPRAG